MAGKVIVYSPNWFGGILCKFKIFINDEQVASIGKSDQTSINYDGDSRLYVQMTGSSKSDEYLLRDNMIIELSYVIKNTFTNKCEAVLISEKRCEGDEVAFEKPVYSVKGVRGRHLKVFEEKCVISTTVTIGSLLTRNYNDGEKTVYYADCNGVQFKRAGLQIGYLQLETASGLMNNRGDNFFNENSFTFDADLNAQMEDIANYIRGQIDAVKKARNTPHNTISAISPAEELRKFKELLDIGVISQEEFDAKKKQLLGL